MDYKLNKMMVPRTNPQLKYYSQPKSASRQKTWSAIENTLRKEVSLRQQYPDYLEEHRKFILSDYQKKVEEVKQLKERYCISQRKGRTGRQHKLETDRPLYSRSSTARRVLRSAEPMRARTQASNLVSTINVCSFLQKVPLQSVEVRQPLPLSPFQKNVMRRLKTRENMIIKKKIDSFHYDTKNIQMVRGQLFRLQHEHLSTFQNDVYF